MILPMARHRVVAVAEHEVSPFELSVACEVFGADRSFLRDPWYAFTVASPGRTALRTDLGMQVLPDDDLSALDRADTVVVPAGGRDEGPSAELADALRSAHARGARIVSLCTGAFTLAATGLLDGRRATTHWGVADELARQYPGVEVDPAVLYVDEGDVLTSAGAAASMDLCLHIVRTDFGADIANALARRIVVPPHRAGGQAQFVETPVDTDDAPDTLSQVMDWAVEHLHEDVSIEELSRRAAMSERTFARRFRGATGTTPYQWLLGQRVALAQRLLETTDLPVEVVATRAGFGSPAAMRVHFQRIAATSPQSYRRTFRHPESA
jgi:transcriptional regulator GlxA family with amidase domain